MNGIIQTPPDFLSKEQIEVLKRSMLKAFTEDEKETFIITCQRTRLDPFTKQLYATKRYQKVKDADGSTIKVPAMVIVTGIMGLTAIAVRTNHYNGCQISWAGKWEEEKTKWYEAWLSDEYPIAARAVVHHRDRSIPEIGIARWRSYAGQTFNYQTKQWEVTDFWDRMPDFMLAKCAKAQAIRGAFPDQTSGVYIREELDSNITETEQVSADEEKIADNQRREAEFKAEVLSGAVPGVKWVEQKRESRPTPQEALEPGLPQDQIPEKPKKASSQAPPKATPAPSPVASPATVADSRLEPEPKTEKREPSFGQQLKEDFSQQPVPPTDELDMTPAAPPAEPPWKSHVIMGLKHVKFHKRRIGDLSQTELATIENQWLPAIRQQWENANDAQRLDSQMFESAIAYYKMAKPWDER